MESPGYSQTPLARKLGIKPGAIIKIINMPDYYFSLFTDLPENIQIEEDAGILKDVIHYFETEEQLMKINLPELKKEIKQNGVIWVSWYKRSSKIPTDITEDKIRDLALHIGLVDVKVCAVDDIWSGLKLVIPVHKRVPKN